VRAHTRPEQKILVVWAAADVYFLADRAPAIPYMWQRNIQSIPGARADAQRALAARRAVLVIESQRPSAGDSTGRTAAILARGYRRVATADGVPVLAPR
jgi:hypothetical protein